jgi:23S rRNA pseudouridine2605 synthase/23S rRNA pseudouridine2604 synthase
MEKMRLQKYLSQSGLASRRKAEEYIEKGLVRVNGVKVKKLGSKIDPAIDKVTVEDRVIEERNRMIYIIIHKPREVVTTNPQSGEIDVLQLVKGVGERIFPIGRLDKDSSGLLILTNDGALANRLMHPRYEHEKEYLITTVQEVSEGALDRLRQGVMVLGQKTLPPKIKRISSHRFQIILKEGKNRQIRRMFEKIGVKVDRLKRVRIENVRLGELAPGQWRYLNESEKNKLLQRVGIS